MCGDRVTEVTSTPQKAPARSGRLNRPLKYLNRPLKQPGLDATCGPCFTFFGSMTGVRMRDTDEASGSPFRYVDLEERIPAHHPLRKLRQVVK